MFDQQIAKNGRPTAVWVQICIFANPGATFNEVKQLIANASPALGTGRENLHHRPADNS